MKKTTTRTNKKLALRRETVKTMHEIREGRLKDVEGGLMRTQTGCSEEDSGCTIPTC